MPGNRSGPQLDDAGARTGRAAAPKGPRQHPADAVGGFVEQRSREAGLQPFPVLTTFDYMTRHVGDCSFTLDGGQKRCRRDGDLAGLPPFALTPRRPPL